MVKYDKILRKVFKIISFVMVLEEVLQPFKQTKHAVWRFVIPIKLSCLYATMNIKGLMTYLLT